MTQVTSPVSLANLTAVVSSKPIRFWQNPLDFASHLVSLTGPQFMAYDAEFDMDTKGKMLVKHRVTKLPNPFLGRGLKKMVSTQVTVNFNYEKKVEAREGEYSGKGNWSQCVLVDGKPSPLSTHKDDISFGTDGEQQFVANPRLYLRCEIVRFGEGENRADKKMRLTSRYVLGDGTEVSREELEPYLPAPSERKDETDMITVSLNNIVELRAGGEVWRQWQGATAM